MKKEINIALMGNPNTGKSTIFNSLTGLRQHVGNYPGVTIEKREGSFEHQGRNVKVFDLPGTYSLTAYSPEEIIARNFIINEKPDVVVDILDSGNLERNLYLAVQIMELKIPLILVFNMSDEAEKKGIDISYECFSKLLGVPIVKTVGHKGEGIVELKNKVVDVSINGLKTDFKRVEYGKEISSAITRLSNMLVQSDVEREKNIEWLSLKLLENDSEEINYIKKFFPENSALFKALNEERRLIENFYNDDVATIVAEKRYGFISGVSTQCLKATIERKHEISDKIDMVLTNRLVGIPIFLILLYIVFWLTFTIGSYPMDWIDAFFGFLSEKVGSILPEDTIFKSLLIDGVIGGVGSVVIFLPNILILFLALGILEYSGYMARAAFIVDKLMYHIGLHGKSFIPMLIGFGCSVPGIMATRTLESKKERFLTILVLPLMSCGARLPIYILIIQAFFPENYHGAILWGINIFGVILAIVVAKVLKLSIFKGESAPFVMELPPYRIPTFRALLTYVWEKGYLYLKKAGTIILAVSILLWFLSSFPKVTNYSQDYEALISKVESNQLLKDEEKESKISEIENLRSAEEVEKSYMGKIGKTLEPIFKPLGFDWKISTAILGALAAKEVFVAQLGIINSVGEADEESESLIEKIKSDYNPLIGFCILLWGLISAPCIATFAITKKETGSWKYAFYQFFGLTVLAYFITLIAYQIGRIIL